MNPEIYITLACLIAATTIITATFRFAYWRNRAERAEAALARVEAAIIGSVAEVAR